MTGAELKCIREYLALSISWMAEYLGCDERRLQRMEVGRERINDAIAAAANQVYVETQDTVNRLVTKYRQQLDAKSGAVTMPVYRNEHEYERAFKHARFPVVWHRMAAARVAEQLPELILDYAEKAKMNVPPWERDDAKVRS